MTKKCEVDLSRYTKPPRHLPGPLLDSLKIGALSSVLSAVLSDRLLALEIRERRFNVYYGGGNLMRVDGRTSPWTLQFDSKYFNEGTLQMPSLPGVLDASTDAENWVAAFPQLKAGMEDWWTRHPKGERAHCQAMAAANNGQAGTPQGDFLIIDMEYQWAQRRLDLIAAEKRPSPSDPEGWAHPAFVFVEVKSEYSACAGSSGLTDHARDYSDILSARGGAAVAEIKKEYEHVWAQKRELGLLNPALGFEGFAEEDPGLLVVLVSLDPGHPSIAAPLRALTDADSRLERGDNRLMCLGPNDYTMRSSAAARFADFRIA